MISAAANCDPRNDSIVHVAVLSVALLCLLVNLITLQLSRYCREMFRLYCVQNTYIVLKLS